MILHNYLSKHSFLVRLFLICLSIIYSYVAYLVGTIKGLITAMTNIMLIASLYSCFIQVGIIKKKKRSVPAILFTILTILYVVLSLVVWLLWRKLYDAWLY